MVAALRECPWIARTTQFMCGAADASKRKLQSAAAAWNAELDAEIDAELQDDAEREREHVRSLGLRLAVVEGEEDEGAQEGGGGDPRGVERVFQATALRMKQRQLIADQWIKYAEDVWAGRLPP